jgi:hypothetical protein
MVSKTHWIQICDVKKKLNFLWDSLSPNKLTITPKNERIDPITYLPSTVRGGFFFLYMVMDWYSRKTVACQIYEHESGQ